MKQCLDNYYLLYINTFITYITLYYINLFLQYKKKTKQYIIIIVVYVIKTQ